ncbi:response regulator transcription factor [Anaerosporobacter faecicola]|uniref:response regulator transcription factor n=1 Tax=Anaerosporobacter faecicola TaxID=2718714 RepID=UPI001438F891|nr:response regulator transcription factor [Anaerosporobacter faecicola]
MFKILIVEDDQTIAKILSENLNKWGYESTYVEEFDLVIQKFRSYSPHLVLMDITLPYFNGFYWCSEIRKESNVPIVFISSNTDNMNIVMAMNMGGDDFITKPFDLSVVVAKIQALLRRSYSYMTQVTTIEHRGAILNIGEATLTYQETKLDLTKNEFRILQLLMEKKNTVVSREEIMKKLWDSDCFIDDNTLTVNMTRIRKKLEDIGLEQFITTKKGIGYLISD